MQRIGIIGCGLITRLVHIKQIYHSKEGYVAGFYSRSRKSAEKLRQQYHRAIKRRLRKQTRISEQEQILCQKALESQVYDTVDDLLANVDAVDIATPPKYHMEYAELVAKHQKTIMCEKPPARTLLEIQKSFETLSHVPYYTFTQRSYDPVIQFGKEIIDSGKLGKLVRFEGCIGNSSDWYIKNKTQFWDPLISGGGALIDLGPHVYSVFRAWFPQENWTLQSIQDQGIEIVRPYRKMFGQKQYAVQVEDKAIVDLKFHETASSTELNVRFHAYWGNASFYPKGHKFGTYFRVEGTLGTLSFPHYRLGIFNGRRPLWKPFAYYRITSHKTGDTQDYFAPSTSLSGAQNAFNHFIEEKPSLSTLAHALEIMQIIDGGYISKQNASKTLSVQEVMDYCQTFDPSDTQEIKNEKFLKKLFPI